jgi:hypothetical protein
LVVSIPLSCRITRDVGWVVGGTVVWIDVATGGAVVGSGVGVGRIVGLVVGTGVGDGVPKLNVHPAIHTAATRSTMIRKSPSFLVIVITASFFVLIIFMEFRRTTLKREKPGRCREKNIKKTGISAFSGL